MENLAPIDGATDLPTRDYVDARIYRAVKTAAPDANGIIYFTPAELGMTTALQGAIANVLWSATANTPNIVNARIASNQVHVRVWKTSGNSAATLTLSGTSDSCTIYVMAW